MHCDKVSKSQKAKKITTFFVARLVLFMANLPELNLFFRIFRQIFHILQQLTKGENPRRLLDELDDK